MWAGEASLSRLGNLRTLGPMILGADQVGHHFDGSTPFQADALLNITTLRLNLAEGAVARSKVLDNSSLHGGAKGS